jgi:hypothetical protein
MKFGHVACLGIFFATAMVMANEEEDASLIQKLRTNVSGHTIGLAYAQETATTVPCGSEKIGSGQCFFERIPDAIKEGVPLRSEYDHIPNYGHYRILADNAEACAAKLAPTAGTDACPNPNMFIYNHKYKICTCLRRPSRTDCDTYKHPGEWNTYSFAGCTVPPPQPQPAAPPGQNAAMW